MLQNLTAFYRGLVGFTVVGTSGLLALLLRLISFGKLTDFNRKYLVAYSSRLVLKLIGITPVFPPVAAFPKEQVFYTFNHNSYLDLLLITALGLPKNRFLLSEKTLVFLPLTLAALGIGTMYIPQKKDKARRLKFFQKLHKQAVKEGFSVFASSEGPHNFIHGIAPFNKGVYHFAVSSNLPVVPVYFHIPEASNPMRSFHFKSGTVRVEVLQKIPTNSWQLADLSAHSENVRQLFISRFNEAHSLPA